LLPSQLSVPKKPNEKKPGIISKILEGVILRSEHLVTLQERPKQNNLNIID